MAVASQSWICRVHDNNAISRTDRNTENDFDPRHPRKWFCTKIARRVCSLPSKFDETVKVDGDRKKRYENPLTSKRHSAWSVARVGTGIL